MKIFVSTTLAFFLMNSCVLAQDREIYHNKVSDRWDVIGSYNGDQQDPSLRTLRCIAHFKSPDANNEMAVVYDMRHAFSFVALSSRSWHGKNLSPAGPFPIQMHFTDANDNITDRTQAGDYYWGRAPKYYTLQNPQLAIIQFPQPDIMIHAAAESDKLKLSTQDEGLTAVEMPIGHPKDLPAAWVECVQKLPKLMQEDQAKASH